MTVLATPLRPAPARTTKRFEGFNLLLGYPTFLIGIAILLFWIGCAIFGRYIVDPLGDDILNSLSPPSAQHWFGTDELGRDMFARVIAGAQDILVVAPLATPARDRARHGARPRNGVLPRTGRRYLEPHRGGPCWPCRC